ncbi:MAG TPA: hypothetical protein PLH94_08680 [Fimbriimonadaceae bacterium]|nr:hypothetical protein [Fimbriimonadaceae bacterium]
MLTPLLALAVLHLPQGDAQEVLGRFEAYMKARPTFTATMTVKSKMTPAVGQATYSVARPGLQVYNLKWGLGDYLFAQNREGVLEMSRDQRTYVIYAGIAGLEPPPLDVSEIADAVFPFSLLAGSITKTLPTETQYTWAGKDDEGDRVNIRLADPRMSLEGSVWIGADGALRKYDLTTTGADGVRHALLEGIAFTSAAPKLGTLESAIPNGFVPSRLPAPTYPLEIGRKLPTVSWTDARTGRDVRPPSGRWALLALDDAAASPKYRKTLDAAIELVRAQKGTTFEIRLGSTAPAAGAWDKSGSLERAIGVPGAPFWVLVKPDGTIGMLWYGFDGERPNLGLEALKGAFAESE